MSKDNHSGDQLEDLLTISNHRTDQTNFDPIQPQESAQFRNFREENNRLIRKLYFETGVKKKPSKPIDPPTRAHY